MADVFITTKGVGRDRRGKLMPFYRVRRVQSNKYSKEFIEYSGKVGTVEDVSVSDSGKEGGADAVVKGE